MKQPLIFSPHNQESNLILRESYLWGLVISAVETGSPIEKQSNRWQNEERVYSLYPPAFQSGE